MTPSDDQTRTVAVPQVPAAGLKLSAPFAATAGAVVNVSEPVVEVATRPWLRVGAASSSVAVAGPTGPVGHPATVVAPPFIGTLTCVAERLSCGASFTGVTETPNVCTSVSAP